MVEGDCTAPLPYKEVTMAHHETREIASYLRNGSLWIGRFVDNGGELDFGDDRFDSTHGLASVECAESTANENDLQVRAWARSIGPTNGGKPWSAPRFAGAAPILKRAA
jgi:hypothetical protein